MKSKGLSGVLLTALLCGCGHVVPSQGMGKAATNAPQTSRPPQKALTAANPITFTPKIGSDGRVTGMGQQWFYYDAKTRRASTPDGPTLTSAGSTIPIRILSFNGGSFAGTMSYFYKDVILDLAGIQDEKFYPIGVVQVNDDQQLILIAVQGHRNLLIDDNFEVFADDARITSPGAPSVTVNIVTTRSEGGKAEPLPAVHGVLERGGGSKQTFETGRDGEANITLENVEETSVVAEATDANGERIQSLIPLPMKGAGKGLVTQTVILEFGKQK